MRSLLSVKNLGKAFFTYRSEWQRFARWFGIYTKYTEAHWVLRDINFDIQAGEAIGIIGQNGAGKSTLLKIITGTMQPTAGQIQVDGRISAMLELGMGFNPDLSGRKNVEYSAGLMGFSTKQIQEAMPTIEAFAEIGNYFDEPVRIYSSGMQMRVAFSVATAFRPEILIVDEALSVGDTYFQHKSFNRIREFQKQGTTLLIVSHDKAAIQGLCDRVILLHKGMMIKDGEPEEIFDYYNALIADKESSKIEQIVQASGKMGTVSGTGEATVEDIGMYSTKGKKVKFIGVGDPVELRIMAKVHRPIKTLVLGYSIKDRLGQVMFGTNTWHTEQIVENPIPGNKYEFIISFPANLGVGSYSVQTALVDRDTHLKANYEWRDLALVFNVINFNKTHFSGCLWHEPIIKIEKL